MPAAGLHLSSQPAALQSHAQHAIGVGQPELTYQPGQPPVPLSVLPFGYPTAANFQYGYSNQANVGIEHQFGKNWTVDHCSTTSTADAA